MKHLLASLALILTPAASAFADDGWWSLNPLIPPPVATLLHLMGIDHEKLTVRTAGVDRRLTDVHGHVIRDILA